MLLEVINSLSQKHFGRDLFPLTEAVFGRSVYLFSVRYIGRCHLQTTAAGPWLLKAVSVLCAPAAEWVREVRKRCES